MIFWEVKSFKNKRAVKSTTFENKKTVIILKKNSRYKIFKKHKPVNIETNSFKIKSK